MRRQLDELITWVRTSCDIETSDSGINVNTEPAELPLVEGNFTSFLSARSFCPNHKYEINF